MSFTLTLKSPLFADWQAQYVRLHLPGVKPGTPLRLTISGEASPFQYTGQDSAKGAEVIAKFGFAKGETKTLEFADSAKGDTDLKPKELSLRRGCMLGYAGRELVIPSPKMTKQGVAGPFASFAGYPFDSVIFCEKPFESATLTRTCAGPLYTEYVLRYEFAEYRHYTVRFRCFRHDPYIEVGEHVALQMNARLEWTLNPDLLFDSIVSRDWFENEIQPIVEPLKLERTRDVLCRLQMPVLSEYFIPNNRGWFGFFNSQHAERGMLGFLGLYGDQWVAPVDNLPELRVCGGRVEWHAPLVSGKRFWLLYAGPVETTHAPAKRLVFHRLHAEFNGLRLDEHLDLTGDQVFDGECWREPAFFVGDDYHAQARTRYAALEPMRRVLTSPDAWMRQNGSLHLATYAALLDPAPVRQQAVYDLLIDRFELWVRQFQGWRDGRNDYSKNVIGFSRYLRGMLIAYELLRKDECLTAEQIGKLNAYFVFAARRINDEGRWPHSKTSLHPDHPESTRDLYTYGGEHKPDRLVWTNSLPNFQSDPMCALAHISALFRGHADAEAWRDKALDDINRQLSAYCGKSGAWVESINYALYTFAYSVITFRPVKYRWGIDYFNDERVRRYAGWLCRFFGPYDKRFEAYTWPGIGNSRHPAGGSIYLMAYAGELPADDPLRSDCIATYQLQESWVQLGEHYPNAFAAMAPIPEQTCVLRPAVSEVMDEVGVSLREKHMTPQESYLFQKIGFAKDHYEGDETAFDWHAKGTPFTMDYGTYTGDVGGGAAHNLVEIPDEDNLRRGYLAEHLFSPAVDFTRCEVPVTLKLLWGRVRSFAEIENKDGKIDRTKTPYFYIGDKNPVGPKTWKTRVLLFAKPDYIALCDRVYGEVPHRYNLHFTGDALQRDGALLTGRGRFDLDLLGFVQYPSEFDVETGELIPKLDVPDNPDEKLKHRQCYFRLYNRRDGIYRTLIFARERGRDVRIESLGGSGMKVVTPEYTDFVFVNTELAETLTPEVKFRGATGWIRRRADGQVLACVPDGDWIEAFGVRVEGRGPWTYNLDGAGRVAVSGGLPRNVTVTR